MGPTEALVREHEDIRTMLAVVMEMCRRLESGQRVEPDHLTQAVEFIQGYADRYHHAKEEDLLFPAMERHGYPRDGGPVGVMLAEHDEGRGYVRAAGQAVQGYREGDQEAGRIIAANLRNYAGMLDSHIEKENNVLYPMADEAFTPDDQAELQRRFDDVNAAGDAPARYERFQGILRELKAAYPPQGAGKPRKRPGW